MKPVTSFMKIMERAARNGSRAHLPPEIVRHIIGLPVWLELLKERQQEMIAQWTPPDSVFDGPPSGGAPRPQDEGAVGAPLPEIDLAAERALNTSLKQLRARASKRC